MTILSAYLIYLFEVIRCANFDIPIHATISCTSSSDYSSECRLTPKPGYTLSGPDVIQCRSNGEWTSDVGIAERE